VAFGVKVKFTERLKMVTMMLVNVNSLEKNVTKDFMKESVQFYS